jgi:His/Glu/Gln/Arg/opine family amino acid ABC transporter permease subunit
VNYHWDWHFFTRQVQAGEETYVDWLLTGLGWTLACSLSAWIIAFALGTLVGVLRTSRHRGLVALAAAWVELFRNIPLLVQMFLWFFVVPEFLPREVVAVGQAGHAGQGIRHRRRCASASSPRRGLPNRCAPASAALPHGQRDAALALGLNLAQAWRHVILPQALRIVIRAADLGIHEHLQELVSRLRDRTDGTDLPGAPDAGGFRAGHRDLPRGDAALFRLRLHRQSRHGVDRTAHTCAGDDRLR